MEKNSKEKFPECVKSLLLAAGFDTLLSLGEVCESKITTAEQFLTENKHHIHKLDCCYSAEYKNLNEFHFLPGHKSLILSIPNKVLQIKKRNEELAIENDRMYESLDNTSADQVHGYRRMSGKQRGFRSAYETKIQLVRNLMVFLKKIGAPFPDDVITEEHILNFNRDIDESSQEPVYKCSFFCPFCSKSIPVTHKKFWMSSNATGHLKRHAQNDWQDSQLPLVQTQNNSEHQFF